MSALERRNEWEDDSSGDELSSAHHRPTHSADAAADTQPRKRASHGSGNSDSSNNSASTHSQQQLDQHTEQRGHEAQEEEVADAEAEEEEAAPSDEQPQHADEEHTAFHARNGSNPLDGAVLQLSDSESAAGGASDDEDARAKHARFEKLRKQHYKMGDALKAHHVET